MAGHDNDTCKLVGQILEDAPDCADTLRKAEHALMDTPSPEGLAGSPVNQAVQQQARTAAALEQVGLVFQQRQASMTAQEQGGSSCTLPGESLQEEAARMSSMHMAAIASMYPTLQPGGTEHAKVAGVMKHLAMEAATFRAEHRADIRKLANIYDRKDSSEALLAIGMAVQNQQVQGLTRFHAANLWSRNTSASAATVMPQLKQPITSPVRKKQAQQTKAEKIAYRQSQNMSRKLNSMPGTEQTSQKASGSHIAVDGAPAAAPPAINDGLITVYPGHNGEPFWTEWKGK